MPSLIDIRRRIRSVKNTQQITKAMKMVSAAKLRRAQDRVLSARPYARMMEAMLADVAAAAPQSPEGGPLHPLLEQREEKRIQLVLVTADRGLAGSFNANLIKAAQRFLEEHAGQQVELILVGRKGRDFFRKRNVTVTAEWTGIANKPTYADAQAVAGRLIQRFAAAEVDAVYLVYNEFKSVVAQKLTVSRILPMVVPEQSSEKREYLMEQPPEQLLGTLLPRYVEIAVYQALIESTAAEQAARMTAMDAASTNAGEVIEKLTLYMNRVRQASITKEIIEVVSGAAALE